MVTEHAHCLDSRYADETAAEELMELGGKVLLIVGFFGLKAALMLGAFNFILG